MPRFHKHIRPWCAENVCLRKSLPFLTFVKPTISSESKADANIAGGIQPQSTASGDPQAVTRDESAGEPYEHRVNTSKNPKAKRRQKSGTSAATVDYEAPLLALAQRIPMRQVRSPLQCNMLFFNHRQNDASFPQLGDLL